MRDEQEKAGEREREHAELKAQMETIKGCFTSIPFFGMKM